MTEQQKRGLAVVSVVIVGFAVLYLVWLASTVMGSGARLAESQPGRSFMLAIHNWNGLSIVLKSLPALITLGITIFAKYKLKDWQFFALLALSAIGVAASIYLFLEVSSVETAKRFWPYSPVDALDSYNPFVSAAQTGLGAVGAWLVALSVLQLGVKMTAGGVAVPSENEPEDEDAGDEDSGGKDPGEDAPSGGTGDDDAGTEGTEGDGSNDKASEDKGEGQ